MATIRIGEMTIPRVQQEITVNDEPDNVIWCSSINLTAGLGGSSATFELPESLFDSDRSKYKDARIIVKAGLGNGPKTTLFIGYTTGDAGELSEDNDSGSLSAYTVGHFLTQVPVGIDLNHWQYEYPAVSPRTGLATGFTPLYVLTDLFNRLPQEWKDEVALGDTTILADVTDVPISSFLFSLQDYRSAIEMIAGSFGDITIKETFRDDGRTYLDFFKVSSPANPVSLCRVANWDTDPEANVGRISPAKMGDQIINHVQVFGRNQAFVVTLKSNVPDMAWSEQEPAKALRKDWDAALEEIVKKAPSMASSDRVQYSVTAKENSGSATTFKCDLTFTPVLGKVILIHNKTGERMLVTGYTPKVPADPEADPPTEETPATVTVVRMYQASEGQEMADIKAKDILAVEIPGISKVFKSYKLPEIFKSWPRKHILQGLPLLDDTREPLDSQTFLYKSTLNPNAVPEDDTENHSKKLTGVITDTPVLIPSCRLDLENHKIELRTPALQPVAKEKDAQGKIKTTYAEAPVGITICYIDDRYQFGWNSGIVASDSALPWGRQTAREQLEEMQHNQLTNVGYPLIDWLGNEHLFEVLLINPKTGTRTTEAATLRYDIVPLKAAADRILSERNRRQITYGIMLDWFDPSYVIGNRLVLTGVADYIPDTYTINQATFSMPIDGDHTTEMTVDNRKPPYRAKFQTRIQ